MNKSKSACLNTWRRICGRRSLSLISAIKFQSPKINKSGEMKKNLMSDFRREAGRLALTIRGLLAPSPSLSLSLYFVYLVSLGKGCKSYRRVSINWLVFCDDHGVFIKQFFSLHLLQVLGDVLGFQMLIQVLF